MKISHFIIAVTIGAVLVPYLPSAQAAQKPVGAIEQPKTVRVSSQDSNAPQAAQKQAQTASQAIAPASEPTKPASQATTPAITQSPAPELTGETEAAAKAYIYQHESGNNPHRMNEIGCFGLGQDCNNIVLTRCGADYACQDEYFTSYMKHRYGTWRAAEAFWKRTDPRPYPGHWW